MQEFKTLHRSVELWKASGKQENRPKPLKKYLFYKNSNGVIHVLRHLNPINSDFFRSLKSSPPLPLYINLIGLFYQVKKLSETHWYPPEAFELLHQLIF